MTNGKRMTNQFTDEQIEAGAKAYWLASEREIHDKPITWEWDKEERRRYMWAARQVLAGVTPQAESALPETGNELRDVDGDLISSGKHLRVLQQGMYVCDTCTNVLGLNVRWDHAIKRYDHAPVQPSSTVDEDALAEVIRRSYENEQGLKIRDDKRTARAVAEWLRGESR